MIDNIYNDYLLDAPGSKIDIKVLNNSLKIIIHHILIILKTTGEQILKFLKY